MKLSTLALIGGAVATGYVLGTRSGRARFEQLRSRANDTLHDPRTQQNIADLAGQVHTHADRLPDSVSGLVAAAARQVQTHFDRADRVPGDDART